MKKSTILRKISRLLKTNPSASEILDLVQKEGMLPPYSHQCDLGCECGCHGRCLRDNEFVEEREVQVNKLSVKLFPDWFLSNSVNFIKEKKS